MRNAQDTDNRRHTRGMPSESPAYLPEGAFVVQFKMGAVAVDGPLAGRAEHVVSGKVTHFESPAELLAFLRDVLRWARSGHEASRSGGMDRVTEKERGHI